ncbi:hypothetical protein XIS1_110003 [Xenorhabdus innexi]|uniref:Resolvase n=1 Tax=Xenorhabdus innexi TaxID=290109 RepID=A0A1N6MR11_9GAMM|nr:resolvase [Xenorhabdus innexi]SIP71204.1 hypothetical protein XIS1_110003 [Xenorhabdus innexi]
MKQIYIPHPFYALNIPCSRLLKMTYCRVSTLEQMEQTTENLRREIKVAGFNIQTHRVMEENISGAVTAYERPVFNRLLDRMEGGDILVVT